MVGPCGRAAALRTGAGGRARLAVRASGRADERAQRSERVVGEQARPDELPQRLDERRVVGRADRVGELAEEVAAARAEHADDLLLQLAERHGLADGDGQRESGRVGEVQAHPAVVAGQSAGARPDHLAGRGELVEHGGGVVAHPRGQDQRLPRRGGDRALRRAGRSRRRRRRRRGASRRRAARRAGSARRSRRRPARPPGAGRRASGCAGAAAPRRRTTRCPCRPGGTRPR